MTKQKKNNTVFGKVAPSLDKKTHVYSLNGSNYVSVTTFIKSYFEQFDAKKISKYVALARRNKGEKVTATQVRKEWKQTATDGTKVHQQIEDFIRKQKEPTLCKAQSGVLFLKENVGIGAKQIPECIIWSDKYGIAGTSDLVVVDDDGHVSIYDWKTNKTLTRTSTKRGTHPATKDMADCNFVHYQLQLSTYAYILETEFGMPIRGLTLVHLHDDRYTAYDIDYKREKVQEMLEAWQKN